MRSILTSKLGVNFFVIDMDLVCEKMTKQQYMDMYAIVGAAMEVYNTLGRGMEELIYQEALQIELENRGIKVDKEVWLDMYYKGQKLKKRYKADFVVNEIIVELKSVSIFSSEHRAQLFNYMRITKQKRGILMNFGGRSFASERYWYQEEEDDFVLLKESNYRDYVNMSSK